VILFPFSDYWWLYGVFLGIVFVMLALDLGVFHKEAHEVSVKEATVWTTVWISLALLFNLGLYYYSSWKFANHEMYTSIPNFDAAVSAKNVALEFLTGFVVEKALAVDNIFVFAVVFGYFAIPRKYQHRVLFWGILGALFFRGIFIALGSVLMQYKAVVYFFGALLIFTGAKMMFSKTEETDLSKNAVIKWLQKIFKVTPTLEGDKFFVLKNGVRYATPLFLALIFLELTDIIFAVDSVPAIFAITKEPFIVFTSNIFAILGLRSMYFMLSGVLDKFALMKYGLAAVLVFVGLKMVYPNDAFGGKFPIGISLAIIGALIGGSIVASLIWAKPKKID
jgi:tellurite resistance protein TerC